MVNLETTTFAINILSQLIWLQISSETAITNKEGLANCYSECGLDVDFFGGNDRAIGGAPIENFAFVGQLRFKIPNCDFEQKCTATIISQKFLITAAHCVNYEWTNVVERCGNVDLKSANFDTEDSSRMIFHPTNIRFVAQTNLTIENSENVYGVTPT